MAVGTAIIRTEVTVTATVDFGITFEPLVGIIMGMPESQRWCSIRVFVVFH